MGQYYTALLLNQQNKYQFFHPHKYDNGCKLMEHSYLGNFFPETVARSITEKPKRIWWIGDYSEPDDFKRPTDKKAFNYYRSKEENDYSSAENHEWKELGDTKGFLLNHDKKVYIDMSKYGKTAPRAQKNDPEWDVKIHPLPILTATSNQRGGGDYYGINMDLVGTWAGDLLEITERFPDANYKDITPEVVFQEDYEAYEEWYKKQ